MLTLKREVTKLVVVKPRQVRDVAKATGQLGKTDRLDADILAFFAERVRPTPRPLPEPVLQQRSGVLSPDRGRYKPTKVALTACMRKLLTMLNAMMRTNTTWRQLAPPAYT